MGGESAEMRLIFCQGRGQPGRGGGGLGDNVLGLPRGRARVAPIHVAVVKNLFWSVCGPPPNHSGAKGKKTLETINYSQRLLGAPDA